MAQAVLVRAGAFPAPRFGRVPPCCSPRPLGKGLCVSLPRHLLTDLSSCDGHASAGSHMAPRSPAGLTQPRVPPSRICVLGKLPLSGFFGTSLNAPLPCAEQIGIYKSSRRFLEISFSQLDSSSWQRPQDFPPPSGGQQPAHAKCAYFCLVFCSHVDGSGFVSKK